MSVKIVIITADLDEAEDAIKWLSALEGGSFLVYSPKVKSFQAKLIKAVKRTKGAKQRV